MFIEHWDTLCNICVHWNSRRRRSSILCHTRIFDCLSLSSSSLSLRKLPVQGHSRQHKSRFRSVREALMGSSGCEGRLERPPSVQEIVIIYDWSVQFEHQQDHQKYSTRSWQVSSTLIRVMVRLSGVAWNHLIEDTMQLWSTAHRNSALKQKI